MSTPPTDEECIRETRELLAKTPRPSQSDFLVAAKIVWLDDQGQYHENFGVNSETCVMASCICAERCAISQIRLSPHRLCCITSVYITSTCTTELITPGLLCREMLSGFTGAAWERGGGQGVQGAPLPQDIRIVLFYASGEACKVYTLRKELYPHAPLFHGVSRGDLPRFASTFAGGMERVDGSKGGALQRCLDAWNSRSTSTGVVELGQALGLYEQTLAAARTPHPSDTAHPLHLAAGVLLAGGKCVCERQLTALEYGCTVDAVTRVSVAMGGGGGGGGSGNGGTAAAAAAHPLLLFLTDQYGICSSPAAEPRSWLSEFGGEQVKGGLLILVHDESGRLTITTPAELAPMAPNIF